ncbi:hypothetical protein DERF_010138 [Dermatophagoides farinae]|uniref:Uncharacterized protein n=1 Tax=Dermatophagoides farinae TaxID=6954 RepID=A0A922HYQ1_DERFA|nr:hypothetical protein DERF_010138 [Dermatophagoides farinae]
MFYLFIVYPRIPISNISEKKTSLFSGKKKSPTSPLYQIRFLTFYVYSTLEIVHEILQPKQNVHVDDDDDDDDHHFDGIK